MSSTPNNERREVTVGPDAANSYNRRVFVNGSQWCKVYGWDSESAQARAEEVAKSLTLPPLPPRGEEPVAYYNPEHWRRVKPGGESASTIYPHPCGTYRTPLYATPPGPAEAQARVDIDTVAIERVSSLVSAAKAKAEWHEEEGRGTAADLQRREQRLWSGVLDALLSLSTPKPARVEMLVDQDWLSRHTATDPDADVEVRPAIDPLSWLAAHQNCELSFDYGDADEDGKGWCVHRVNGGRNDREWTLIGTGPTPEAALTAALSTDGEA